MSSKFYSANRDIFSAVGMEGRYWLSIALTSTNGGDIPCVSYYLLFDFKGMTAIDCRKYHLRYFAAKMAKG